MRGPGTAQAAPINVTTPSGTLDTSEAYGPITAYGFIAPTSGAHTGQLTATRLFGKTGRSGETDLGLAFTSDYEISAPTESEANQSWVVRL